MHINKVKTWNGLRYAVVDSFKAINNEGKSRVEELVVEYNTGNGSKLAIFPLTGDGLGLAKEIQNSLLKNKR